MNKIKIAVLYGGPSAEHEVSLSSAQNVFDHLDINKYTITEILITKDGYWIFDGSGVSLSENEGLDYLQKKYFDVVLILIHGEYGEDGTIQDLLEKRQIPFVGTDSKASALVMDKIKSAEVLEFAGLKLPVCFNINDKVNIPVVVKPVDRGSSVGISIVKDLSELKPAIELAQKYSINIMVQQYVEGRELTCGVIEGRGGDLMPLIPTEIIPSKKHAFFDYGAKYVSGASKEITPPNLPNKILKEIQNQAVLAHKALGCRHISRTDFILSNRALYILEVNTLPGMTKTSLIPQGALAADIDFSTLLDMIISAAIR